MGPDQDIDAPRGGPLQDVADRVNQEGIGGTLGPEKLPDYKPRKSK